MASAPDTLFARGQSSRRPEGSPLDLFPVPAVQIVWGPAGATMAAINRSYRMAGLADPAAQASLLAASGPRIAALFAGEQLRLDFDWDCGEALARRFYRVSVARRAGEAAAHCVLTLLDQTARVRAERNLRREMATDSLTGLPNREGFGEPGGEAQEAGAGDAGAAESCAVMVVDLARFGRVNACLGGLAGDELLITVARRIKGALSARDRLARIGGDEFGIRIAIDQDAAEAVALGERVRAALSAPFRLCDYEIGVECAIGIAFGWPGDAPEELLRQAQFASKRAKATGRIETYQNQAFAIARAQFGMETDLRRAIEEGGLRLTYQPICDLTTGGIVAFEALTRWRDEGGREHSPVDFIPVAEESGLIVPLGRWAIDEAVRTLAAWDRAAGGDCGARVAVNLSAIQLQRDAVAPLVRDAIERHGLTGERLTLELTESALVSDPERIAGTMRALKEMGARLAMDDFGTGYSNLALLQQLPIDILKIDRSLVTGMLVDRDKVAIVRAILGLAQALGMATTAEGVETTELSQTLAALGCHYGQGYHYARPLEAEAAFAMLLGDSGER